MWALLAGLLSLAPSAWAEADLGQRLTVGEVEIFADTEVRHRFYYRPLGLELLASSNGDPAVNLLQLRYVGREVSGDPEVRLFRSLLSLRVGLLTPSGEELRKARSWLAERQGRTIQLRPLPIRRIEAALVLALPGQPAEPLPEGHLEADGAAGQTTLTTYWTERQYRVRLDSATSQLVASALEQGQSLFSLTYALFAPGQGDGQQEDLDASISGARDGDEAKQEELRRKLLALVKSSQAKLREAPEDHLVLADTVSIALDGELGGRAVQRFDLNERLPPTYAAVDVFCFDFRDGLRSDLAIKQVEVEAQGVSGAPVSQNLVFEANAPDLYAASLRFPFAVRLDRPYRYRILEIARDGATTVSDWQSGSSWSALLDITSRVSPPDSLPAEKWEIGEERWR
ncbi:MAG: hypothetical protein K0U98_08455 [Deltaproteobacteria bacterium]|nr:hypothetical protein [Deltaproteobacteria bacterium]